MASCTNCGSSQTPGERFCAECGTEVKAPGRGRRGRIWLVVGCAAGALVVGGIAALLIDALRGPGGPEIVLVPVGLPQDDAFAGNLDADPNAARRAASGARSTARSFAVVRDPRTARRVSALAGQVARGNAPGLYGGSRDTRVCKVKALVDFLADPANSEKAAAWAEVLGTRRGQIRTYVGELTAVRLTFDTRVTNHGFVGGEATAVQSLLQAGTAVLVDRSGVPRVKCNCGNPLLEPVGVDEGDHEGDALDVEDVAQNADDAWPSLKPQEAVTVRPAPRPSDAITLADLERRDGLLERPTGSDGGSVRDTGTGDVKVTLEWDSDADVDLHVIDPDGNEIWYSDRGPTSTGGELDVDANVGCDENGSLENIFWPLGKAPDGDYEIKVVGFTVDGCESPAYKLTVKVAGQPDLVYEGTVGEDEEDTYSFTTTLGVPTDARPSTGLVGPLRPGGLGSVELGTSVETAERTTGTSFESSPFCVGPPGDTGVAFERTDGAVSIVVVSGPSEIETESGIGLGDDLADVTSTYGGQARTVPGSEEVGQGPDALYTDGSGNGIVFWADPDGRISLMAAGNAAEIEQRIEFCA